MGALKTHRGTHEETFAKRVAGCIKFVVAKAASREVKKGDALLGVITYQKRVPAVGHVAARGLPGICADPRFAATRGDLKGFKVASAVNYIKGCYSNPTS